MGGYGRDAMGRFNFRFLIQFQSVQDFQRLMVAALFQSKEVMVPLGEWEWVAVTLEDMVLLMDWVAMVRFCFV